MKNKILKLLTILLGVLLLEFVICFIMAYNKKEQIKEQYNLKIEVEKLNGEKEKKRLNDEFDQNKYLATGKNAYERIYNSKQKDIIDLILKLASESCPSNWKTEVRVEEFTNTILLVQVDTNSPEPKTNEIIKYLVPVLKHSEGYLKNVAIYNRKHQCYLFFDEDTLKKIINSNILDDVSIIEAKNKGESFTLYNAIKIDFTEISGHIFIPVTISGNCGSYECTMMLDTGASMTVISLELAQKTGNENLNSVEKKTFSTAKGLMSCPIVEREIIIGDLYNKQTIAVNLMDNSNLLGVDFFESRGYIIDNPLKCIYVWNK